jgi:hypothetical protein
MCAFLYAAWKRGARLTSTSLKPQHLHKSPGFRSPDASADSFHNSDTKKRAMYNNCYRFFCWGLQHLSVYVRRCARWEVSGRPYGLLSCILGKADIRKLARSNLA